MSTRIEIGTAATALWLLLAGTARAADPPATADVLGKLHTSNLTEIEAGRLAQDYGHSSATKDYGKMLIQDHRSSDKKVLALAKEERIDLSASAPVVGSNELADLTAGPKFDKRFARSMVSDHKKDIAEVTAARDTTNDAKLKKLLTALLPTLQKHEEMAEKLPGG
jgi:putative membrane protein